MQRFSRQGFVSFSKVAVQSGAKLMSLHQKRLDQSVARQDPENNDFAFSTQLHLPLRCHQKPTHRIQSFLQKELGNIPQNHRMFESAGKIVLSQESEQAMASLRYTGTLSAKNSESSVLVRPENLLFSQTDLARKRKLQRKHFTLPR